MGINGLLQRGKNVQTPFSEREIEENCQNYVQMASLLKRWWSVNTNTQLLNVFYWC